MARPASLHRAAWRGPPLAWRPPKENLARSVSLYRLYRLGGPACPADPLLRLRHPLLIEAACAAPGAWPRAWPRTGPAALGWDFDGAKLAAGKRRRPRLFARKAASPAESPWRRAGDGAAILPCWSRPAQTPKRPVAPWLEFCNRADCLNFKAASPTGVDRLQIPPTASGSVREDLEALYAASGAMAKERCSGWTLWPAERTPNFTGALRMKASRRIRLSNGGIDCRWLK